MEDSTRGTSPLPPRVEHVRRMAKIIWEVRDSYDIEAAALAEAILSHPGFSGCHDGPAALPAQGEVEKLIAALEADAECVAAEQPDLMQLTDKQLTRIAELLKGIPSFSLPPGYIDPEHQEGDRKLLEVFYEACRSEGGTPDEFHLRGIKAVMALRPTVAAVRAADAAIADEAIEAEFRAWWRANVHPLNVPAYHTITTHVAWGRHLLSRGKI